MAEADLIGGGGAVHIFNSLNRGSLSIQLSEKANFFYC